jgi:hypothetical protein
MGDGSPPGRPVGSPPVGKRTQLLTLKEKSDIDRIKNHWALLPVSIFLIKSSN